MKLTIENIRGIKKAEIPLRGLTVLSGEDSNKLRVVNFVLRPVMENLSEWGRIITGPYAKEPERREAEKKLEERLSILGSGRTRLTHGDRIIAEAALFVEGAIQEVKISVNKQEDLPFTVEYRDSMMGPKSLDVLVTRRDDGFTGRKMVVNYRPLEAVHPKQELHAAKKLVELVKSGHIVFLMSHSPYMVEALKRYSDREGLKPDEQVRFGLMEGGVVEDRDRLSDIFEGFCEPFDEFQRMDAEDLGDG